ncbi:hypothetical protein [Paraburkholderia guartelaensis]|uniref:hypothetical protein n=1 Tax=Paraburkholderia guartelaensis TaxID=2546446 RepID=UPI002AB5E232|nr:hypothetical protein [Paraburkholderia guartelaensis]
MYPFLFRPDGLLLQLCLMLTALDCMPSSLRVPLRIGLVSLVLVFCGLNLDHSPLTTSIGYLP